MNKFMTGTTWNIEEMKNEQLTEKEACISWKSGPEVAGLTVVTVSRS